MKRLSLFALLLSFAAFHSAPSFAQAAVSDEDSAPTWMDEFDPSSPDADEMLRQMDVIYEQETGVSAHLDTTDAELMSASGAGCKRLTCPVWARVNKTTQTLSLYLNGDPTPVGVWLTSTGYRHANGTGIETPNLDTHPNGRIYDRYSSTKFPGGDWNGLGNMPYVVFIKGGVGIHGTPKGNWVKLGKRDSHGCIRIHPDNAKYFNGLVRATGIANVWVTVE